MPITSKLIQGLGCQKIQPVPKRREIVAMLHLARVANNRLHQAGRAQVYHVADRFLLAYPLFQNRRKRTTSWQWAAMIPAWIFWAGR